MSKSNTNTKEYNPQDDVEFQGQAMEMLMDLGLSEDEAEFEVDDFLF